MRFNLEALTIDEIARLRDRVAATLSRKLAAQRDLLDERLGQLDPPRPTRRAYPPVKPKFRNPDRASETWSGRGKRPRWLDAKLIAGGHLDDFRIAS